MQHICNIYADMNCAYAYRYAVIVDGKNAIYE